MFFDGTVEQDQCPAIITQGDPCSAGQGVFGSDEGIMTPLFAERGAGQGAFGILVTVRRDKDFTIGGNKAYCAHRA